MAKIMFNNKYGLEDATLDGYKTNTRRLVPERLIRKYGHNKYNDRTWDLIREAPYHVGDIISIAQDYTTVKHNLEILHNLGKTTEEQERILNNLVTLPYDHPGWKNKMFVSSDYMPNRIEVDYVRLQRLNDITDSDALLEGVRVEMSKGYYIPGILAKKGEPFITVNGQNLKLFDTAKDTFAELIDKVSGRGTWQSNPYVYAYRYNLLKPKPS